MTTKSLTWRTLWYLFIFTPALALVAGIDATITAKSADEALGQVFVVAPFCIATFLLAVVVLISTVRSRAMRRAEKIVSAWVCSAVFPMLLLVAITPALLHWPASARWPMWAGVMTIVNAGWLALMVAARRKANRYRLGVHLKTLASE
jgi:uncharacterized membrane-anchored protein